MSKKKAKRGPKPKPKNVALSVLMPPIRMNIADSGMCRDACERAGQNWSDWARASLIDAAKKGK